MQHALAYQLNPQWVHNVKRRRSSSRWRARAENIADTEAVSGNFPRIFLTDVAPVCGVSKHKFSWFAR